MATRKKAQKNDEIVQQLAEELQRSNAERAALASLLVKNVPSSATPAAQMSVGIRNISYTTVGISKSPLAGEVDVQLHANFGDDHDPNSVAIISWPWWQQLRKGSLVANGIIMRDDSVLGPTVAKAPDDEPQTLAKGHEVNTIVDVRDFIENTPEPELRKRIRAITSETTLRKILAACDMKVAELQAEYPEDDYDRAQKAVDDLPGSYQIAEAQAESRLLAMTPDRSSESTRFNRKGEDREE